MKKQGPREYKTEAFQNLFYMVMQTSAR